MASDNSNAVCIARTFPTINRALREACSPSSASAICRAPLVRFFISELDALSVRSRIEAKGAVM